MGTVHCRGGPWPEDSVPLGEQGLRSLYTTLPAGVWSRRPAAAALIGVAPLLPIEVGRRTPGWHSEFLRLIPESTTYSSVPGCLGRLQVSRTGYRWAEKPGKLPGEPLPPPELPFPLLCRPEVWPLPSATVGVWDTTPSRVPSHQCRADLQAQEAAFRRAPPTRGHTRPACRCSVQPAG